MNDLSPEQRAEILKSSPTGTWALLVVLAGLLLAGWLVMYFGRFLALGPVS